MTPKNLVPGYAVSPQIAPSDAAALKAAGIRTVINNRPDPETPPGQDAAALRAALEAEGIDVVENPLVHGTLSMDHVTRQRDAIDGSDGPVLAYCASGNRSTILWALAMAGRHDTDELIRRAAEAGYDIAGLRGQIDALAAQRG